MKFTPAELDAFRNRMLALPSGPTLGFWDRLTVVPPVLVRLLARTGHPIRVLTDSEIAGSVLTASEVSGYSWSLLWDVIPLERACKFLKACHLDLTDRATWNRTRQYLARDRAQWLHLKRSPEWPRYELMLNAWTEAMAYANRQRLSA